MTLTYLGELTCTRCNGIKSEYEFAISNITKTGRKTRCKSCERELELARRALKVEEIRIKDRERSKTPERKEYAAKQLIAFRKANPDKATAHRKLNRAVKKGEVMKTACMECGEPKVEGHHTNYAYPLEVVWLCHEHHMQLHKEFNSW